MATNFRGKIGKIGCLLLFVALAFPNGLPYRHSDFKMFVCDDLATMYVNFVNFGPVTPEFKRVDGVYPFI